MRFHMVDVHQTSNVRTNIDQNITQSVSKHSLSELIEATTHVLFVLMNFKCFIFLLSLSNDKNVAIPNKINKFLICVPFQPNKRKGNWPTKSNTFVDAQQALRNNIIGQWVQRRPFGAKNRKIAAKQPKLRTQHT